jgi:hypothetical protein
MRPWVARGEEQVDRIAASTTKMPGESRIGNEPESKRPLDHPLKWGISQMPTVVNGKISKPLLKTT